MGSGGLKFRTYTAEGENNEAVVKLTDKKDLFLNEVSTYEFLKNKKTEVQIPRLLHLWFGYKSRTDKERAQNGREKKHKVKNARPPTIEGFD